MMDHFMVRGVNRFVPHAFSPKAFPDSDCPPHFYAQGENPLYRAFGQLMGYGNRVCHLINDGLAVPDVALLYSAESIWAGDDASNIPAARYLSRSQIDFHIIPADVFAPTEEYACSFDGQILKVNHVEYRALVISGCGLLEEHAADFVAEAAAKDFPIVFTNQKPYGIIGKSEAENQKFAEAIRSCMVVPVQEVGTYFRALAKESSTFVLQTAAQPANDRLTTYHYCTGSDTFLILNEMSQDTYNGELYLHASGIPVRYYPWENRTEAVAYEKVKADTIKVSVAIQPLELCVLCVADEMAEAGAAMVFEEIGIQIPEFAVAAVGSKEYLDRLEEAGKGIFEKESYVEIDVEKQEKVTAPFSGMQTSYPDFSGYYIYESDIRLEAEKSYKLVMDEVNESVEVFLNGSSLGMKLQAPFAFVLPAELVKEENELRIEIATLNERKVKALGADISCMSAQRPLSATGLVGNVTLYQMRK